MAGCVGAISTQTPHLQQAQQRVHAVLGRKQRLVTWKSCPCSGRGPMRPSDAPQDCKTHYYLLCITVSPSNCLQLHCLQPCCLLLRCLQLSCLQPCCTLHN